MQLSIISFNAMGLYSFDSLHGFLISQNIIQRQTKIAEVLEKTNADIIALQEVHTYSVLKLLRTHLSDYPYIAYKKYLYGPRGGLVVLSKLPFEKVQYINFKKRGSFFNASFVGYIIQNGILICKLKNYALSILNTHVSPNMDHDWSENNRYCIYIDAQTQHIAEVLQKRSSQAVIAGDFNMAKDSYLYKKFLRLSQARDVFSEFDFPTQHQEFVPEDKKVKRIDYIFTFPATSSFKTVKTTHLFKGKQSFPDGSKSFLSDHVGLYTKLSLALPEPQ
jgi:endonuclease/exonuclease/phosphatase family metal-dependent hydrolase